MLGFFNKENRHPGHQSESGNNESKENLKFSIWKTIEYSPKTIEEYKILLKEKGIEITKDAESILDQAEISSAPRKLNLVIATPKDLGLKRDLSKYRSITPMAVTEKARKKELSELSVTDVLEIRLNYTDQPEKEFLLPFMGDYIVDGHKELILDLVNWEGSLKLSTDQTSDHDTVPVDYAEDQKFVFNSAN